jgi:ribosomal protein S27AE
MDIDFCLGCSVFVLMPKVGALILADHDPDTLIRVSCEKCGRRGQLRASTLVQRYGAQTAMPDLLRKIANCPRQGDMNDPCGAIYPDLVRQQSP